MIPSNTYEYTTREEQEYETLRKQNKTNKYLIGATIGLLALGLGAQKYHTQQAIENITPKIEIPLDKPCYENREDHIEVRPCYYHTKNN